MISYILSKIKFYIHIIYTLNEIKNAIQNPILHKSNHQTRLITKVSKSNYYTTRIFFILLNSTYENE